MLYLRRALHQTFSYPIAIARTDAGWVAGDRTGIEWREPF